MNINRVRTLLVLANVGLAGATGFTVYKEFENKTARAKETAYFKDDLEADLLKAPAPTRKDQTRTPVKDGDFLDLTGDRAKPPEPPRPVEVATTRVLNPLEDLIKVITISYQSENGGIATITRKAEVGPGVERSNFRVGDMIPFANDAIVVEIKQKEVIFRNGERLETLRVPDTLSVPVGGPSGSSASRPSDPGLRPFATYIESKKDSGNITIKPGGDRALEREGEAVLEGVIFSSTEVKGGKALRVDKVPPTSVLAQHGVQDGDVLVSVDGKPMSSKSEVVDYAKQNKNKQVFDVEILRRGNRVMKTVNIQR